MVSGSSSILVLSDSHGDIAALTAVFEWARDKTFNSAVFLGDGSEDLAFASAVAGSTLSWDTVRGNVDTNFSLPGALVLEVPKNGKTPRKLFLSHGNIYRVEEDCRALAATARNNGAEAALFGHTHIPCRAMLEGIFLLNPGSIGRPRSKVGPTFAVLECPPLKPAKGAALTDALLGTDAAQDAKYKASPLAARFFCLAKKGKKLIVKEINL
jgi:putative phosphoesterase